MTRERCGDSPSRTTHQGRVRLTPATRMPADGDLHLCPQVTWASMCSMWSLSFSALGSTNGSVAGLWPTPRPRHQVRSLHEGQEGGTGCLCPILLSHVPEASLSLAQTSLHAVPTLPRPCLFPGLCWGASEPSQRGHRSPQCYHSRSQQYTSSKEESR